MIRIPLVLAVLALLYTPAAAAGPDFADTFKRLCLDEVSGVQARAALARREGFTPIELPTPEGFDQAAALTRGEGPGNWLLVLGSMTTPAREGFPAQSGVSCMIAGADIDIAAIEPMLGLKPYAEKQGVKAYGFELINGRRVGIDGEDAAAVTAALSRNGYFMIMTGATEGGGRFAVVAYSRKP